LFFFYPLSYHQFSVLHNTFPIKFKCYLEMPLFSDKVIPTTANFMMTLVQRKIISIH